MIQREKESSDNFIFLKSSNVNDAEKKRQLENMIREELDSWDDSMLASRANSATATKIRVNSAQKSAY